MKCASHAGLLVAAWSQAPIWPGSRAWLPEDGLPEHTIVGLGQTSDGYLWIATHRSLSRFDGVRFQEFIPATVVEPTEQIRAALLDQRGRLWLAKDGGVLLCMEGGKMAVVALRETSPGAQARAMIEDTKGSIWVGDSAGAVFRIENGKVQVFGGNDPGVFVDTDGRVYLLYSVAGESGISIAELQP